MSPTRHPAARRSTDAADALGGIDNLVYTPAVGPLVRMVDTDADTWRRIFDTNVIGASLVTAAAVPHLTASAGKAVYLSSDAGTFGPPWPGLGAYGVSKAALERLVEAWRAEHSDIGFTNLIVGECAGGEGDGQTGMNEGWDMDLAMKAVPLWSSRGCMPGKLMPVEDLDRRRAHDPAHQRLDIDAARGGPRGAGQPRRVRRGQPVLKSGRSAAAQLLLGQVGEEARRRRRPERQGRLGERIARFGGAARCRRRRR